MVDEPDDTSSNPQADLHLPATGEFDANNIPSTSSALTSADDEDDVPLDDPNDINKISAQNTDKTEEPPNPEGPATPSDIGNPGTNGVATTNPGDPNNQ
jgi:hypothetical protein